MWASINVLPVIFCKGFRVSLANFYPLGALHLGQGKNFKTSESTCLHFEHITVWVEQVGDLPDINAFRVRVRLVWIVVVG